MTTHLKAANFSAIGWIFLAEFVVIVRWCVPYVFLQHIIAFQNLRLA